MNFREFRDFLVLGRGKMVKNLNFFLFIVGDINLQMLGMDDSSVSKLNSLFVVSNSRLLSVEDFHNFTLGLVAHV